MCDYVEYAISCSKQLNSTASNGQKHYQLVQESFIQATKVEIEKVLQEGLDRGIISKEYCCVFRPANACLRMHSHGRKQSKTLENE